MRRKLLGVLTGLLAVTALSGCTKEPIDTESKSSIEESMNDKNDDKDKTKDDIKDDNKDKDKDNDEDKNDNKDQNSGSTGDLKYGTVEEPIKLGEWGIIKVYNATSGEDEELYVKIMNIKRGKEAEGMVEDYNSRQSYSKISYEELNDIAELMAVEYKIKFPTGFTKAEYGLSIPSISFSVKNKEGSTNFDGTFLTAIGQRFNTDSKLDERSTDYEPGDEIAGLAYVIPVIKNVDTEKILLEVSRYPDSYYFGLK